MRAATFFAFGLAMSASAALSFPAASQNYDYTIKHPHYGTIGTYSNRVSRDGERTFVDTVLRIRVEFIGLTLHRQDAHRREEWQGDRLVAFQGVTLTNGKTNEVIGVTRGGRFVITSPDGTVVSAERVGPTNPWSPALFDADVLMSTVSGRLYRPALSESWDELVGADGQTRRLRRYDIVTDKRQVVWFDARGVAVAFRSEEDGVPVDFILVRESNPAAPAIQAAEGNGYLD